MNDPTSSYGAIEWDLIDPEQVAKIEIHRGKGAVKYGQDASGGVILITTARAQALTGSAKLYGGNLGTVNASANAQASRGALTAGLGGSYDSSDGYTVNNDKESWRASFKLGYEPDPSNERAGVSFAGDYREDERGLSGYPDYPTPFSRKASMLSTNAVRVNYREWTSNTSFVSSRNHNTDAGTGLDRRLGVTELSENLNGTRAWRRAGSTSFGAGYQQNRASGSAFDGQREHTWSVFAAHVFAKELLPVQVSTGVRANFNSAFDDALNPELKLSYARGKVQFAVAFSGSNNTPSFYQRYNETSTTAPNPELEMETARNYSVSLSTAWSAAFSTGLNLFYNVLHDRITYVLGDTGTGRYENFGEVTYTGGDVSLNWQPARTVTLKAGYTYLEAIDEQTGKWLSGKSRHSGNASLQFRPTEALSLNLSGEFETKAYRNTANTIVLPGHWLADFKAEYGWKRFSLFGEITNMLDKRYLYGDGLEAPPRAWFVGVGYRL